MIHGNHPTQRTILLAAIAVAMFAATSDAALYYLKTGFGGTNWNIPSDWNSNPDGSGTNASTMTGNDFSINAKTLGTPTGATAFGGNSLDLGGGTLNLRNGGAKTATAMTGSGNSTIASNVGATTLTVSTFTNSTGATTTLKDNQGVSGTISTIGFSFGTLTGSGDFALSAAAGVNPGGSKTLLLTVTTGTGFTGNITWAGTNKPSLQFGNDLVLGGGLIATDAASRITLDKNVTFASVTLNATSLTPGTYSFAALNASYNTIFNDGGSGSITVVPEPATMALLGLGGLLTFKRKRSA